MSTLAHSEATAAPAAADPARKSAPAVSRSSVPDTVLRLQRTAGNAAVARAVARPAAQSLQRCGANCSCTTCGGGKDDELLDEEKLGAGLLRSAVAARGV